MHRPVGNTADVYMECEKWYGGAPRSPQGIVTSDLTRPVLGTPGTHKAGYLARKRNEDTYQRS